MMEGDNKIDVAYFEVNAHGRILSGNRRFCRMFGFGGQCERQKQKCS